MRYSSIFQNKSTVGRLICPVCGGPLEYNGERSLVCNGGRHTFDISAKGHVNLSLGHSGGGDPKEAVRSRSEFLRKDHYLPFASYDIFSRFAIPFRSEQKNPLSDLPTVTKRIFIQLPETSNNSFIILSIWSTAIGLLR